PARVVPALDDSILMALLTPSLWAQPTTGFIAWPFSRMGKFWPAGFSRHWMGKRETTSAGSTPMGRWTPLLIPERTVMSIAWLSRRTEKFSWAVFLARSAARAG